MPSTYRPSTIFKALVERPMSHDVTDDMDDIGVVDDHWRDDNDDDADVTGCRGNGSSHGYLPNQLTNATMLPAYPPRLLFPIAPGGKTRARSTGDRVAVDPR